jgi:DNA-binding GntR family transcriptional regulator
MPSQLAPIQVESTPAVVAARIRAGIFARRFPPDSQLNEVELAHELNVSRGPIRDAFTRLIHEGLLRRERNRGVFVVALDDESIRDVYFAREVVEQAAALRINERRDEPALRALDAILARLEEAIDRDWPEVVVLDLEFHRCLVSGAGSERLNRAFEPLYAQTRLCLSYLEAYYDDRASLIEEHRAIVEAIRGDDPALITELVHAHMAESAAHLTTSQEGE